MVGAKHQKMHGKKLMNVITNFIDLRRKPMTRLDRVLKLLEEYDSLVAIAFTHYCVGQDCRKMLEYLRLEKAKLTQELVEHGCRREN
jgi:hypothetical protein